MTSDDNPRQARQVKSTQNPPKQNPDAHRFWFEGRQFLLKKRNPGRNSPWYTDFIIHGRRFHQSLETNVLAAAQQRAISLISEAKRQKWEAPDAPALKKPATIEALTGAYMTFAVQHIKERSATNNVSALRQILAIAFDLPQTPPAAAVAATNPLAANVLTAQTIRRFREKFLAARLRDLAGDALERARNVAFISGTSMLSQGRSVFTRQACTHYEDLGLHLPPTVAEFRSEPPFKRVGADYMPASDAIVAKTFAAIAEQKDANLVAAFWLATGAGLRKGEIARAKWGHLSLQQGKPWFDSDIPGKDGRPIKVPLLTFAANALKTLRADQPDHATILTGTHTEVTETVFRRIGEWMTALGWESEKKVHELRAWAGSKIIETHGMEAASNWMRHKELRTTQLKYGRYVKVKDIDIALPGAVPTAI